MFSENKKQNKAKNSSNNTRNLIGVTSKIIGDITSEGDFRIDGILEGKLETTGKIVIGNQGHVKGDIICRSADVEGRITGSVHCKELLSLKSTATIDGEVFIEKLEIEPGAIFNATCNMKGIKALNNEADSKKKNSQTAS